MIIEDKEVDVFVGSKIGSFKHIKYHTDTAKNNKKYTENIVDIKTLEKDDSITVLEWGNNEQTEILLGRKNQQVQIYDTTQDKFTKTVTADYAKGEVVGIGKYKRRLITAVSSGVVKIWSKKDEVVLQTGGELDALKSCSDDTTLFATGGKENELKVWRIGESVPIFTAKNLPNDWLQLRQPVWTADLCFMPGEGGALLAVCSRYGYVRLYDTRAQRRPVCNVEFKAMAATCITPSFDEKNVLVGFGRGQIHQVDLRKGKPDKGYKGCVGAVTSIAIVKEPKLVVSVSLDRHIRVHDYDSKELKYKQYLTSKLSCVLTQTESSTPLRKAIEEDVKSETEIKDEDDLDELFEDMEAVSEKPKKKRALEDDSEAKKKKTEEVPEDAIVKLLKSTERTKKIREKKKKEKKAKSVFHNP